MVIWQYLIFYYQGGILRNRHLLKRFMAAALSAVVMCTSLPYAPQTARAAAPYVSLRTRFKTLQAGQSNWMTLKNNTIGWKITKAATDDRTTAMVYGRKEDGLMIKGKSVEEPPSGQGLRQHPGKNMRARL